MQLTQSAITNGSRLKLLLVIAVLKYIKRYAEFRP